MKKHPKKLAALSEVEEQIYQRRKDIRYDIRDLTVEVIANKYDSSLDESLGDELLDSKKYNCIFIPEYQRDFTWDESRQSKLVESILLGLPIPFIFVAENRDSSWEIVDGSQRIRTLHNFISNGLELRNLESLNLLNGYKFDDLDDSRKGKLLNSALRLIVLNEETSDDAKKDMFERINRGSDLLKPMEKRKGIYPGAFNKFIYEYCANSEKFISIVAVDKWLERRQEREELLLRFFFLSETDAHIKGVSGGLSSKLDSYFEKKNSSLEEMEKFEREQEIERLRSKIDRVVDFVKRCFPFGFRHAHNPQTKRSVFEAISVGTWLYLKDIDGSPDYPKFKPHLIAEQLKSSEFKKFTHVANQLHHADKLKGRIDFIYEMLRKMGS